MTYNVFGGTLILALSTCIYL